MLFKFINRGTGSGKSAMDYLFDKKNHKKEDRHEAPEILRGNPQQTVKLIDSLEFKQKYSSAVIAFHPDDNPTDEQINEAIDSFVAIAFAGLEPDQYDYCAVLHREKHSCHIHIIIPRVELTTGKSFNAAPPGWRFDFDTVRDYLNAKNDWASPDISEFPENAKLIQLGDDGINKNSGRAEVKKDIEEILLSRVMAGKIENRNDVIETLELLDFEISRKGKNYVSVKFEGQNIRLKGAMFNEKWTATREIKTEKRSARGGSEVRRLRADTALEQFKKRVVWRIKYNTERYPYPTPKLNADIKRKLSRSRKNDLETEIVNKKTNDNPYSNNNNNINNGDDRELGSDTLSIEQNQLAVDRDREKQLDIRRIANERWIVESEELQRSGLHSDRCNETGLPTQLHDNKKVENDGIRETANRSAEGNISETSRGDSGFDGSIRRFDRAGQKLNDAISRYSEIIKRGVERMIKNSDKELDRFKSDINLVEFAWMYGYRKIERKSSKGFIVMSKSTDSQKIIICTGRDGHGIYFENPDQTAKTVIDMCQTEEKVNLGHARKILRNFSGHPEIENLPELSKPKKTAKDLIKIRLNVSAMKPINIKNRYLAGRGISEETLKDDRFLVMQEGPWKNVTFIHYNIDGEICGYEQKNTGKSKIFDKDGNPGKSFTFFSEGGEKGAWQSNNIIEAETIVICEAAIDALSHAQLNATGNDVAYISFCGGMSAAQLDLIEKITSGKRVIIATDNDDKGTGKAFAEEIKNKIENLALSVSRELSVKKDWNDDLKEEIKSLERITNTL